MLSVGMEAKKNNDKKLHFISSEELILICLALSLKVSLKGYKQYFSVGLDEQDKSFIDYVKAKANKSQELEGEKKKSIFLCHPERSHKTKPTCP